MTHHTICPICLLESPDVQVIDDTGDYGEQIIYDCARCGKFLITGIACGIVDPRVAMPFLLYRALQPGHF